MMLSSTTINLAFAATQTDINTATANGLAYLASIQAGDGHWGGNYYVACTAMVVLAFENAGYHAGDGSIYAGNVQNGLNYLFATANVQAIGVQPAGDPDTNGNGLGIYFNDPWGQVIYQTPMVLMAIVGSQTQMAVATTGPVNVIGRTYYDIVVDIVDYLSWAQNDYGNGRGGWRYGPNYDSSSNSDNSISQWPTLGLMTAELWGINAPSFVKNELLNYWVPYAQNLDGTPASNYYYGAFAYAANEWGPRTLQTIAETGTGILELTYCGVPKTDPRVVAAEGFINRDWLVTGGPYGWSVNLGNMYAMYAVMKAYRLTIPTPIQFLANYDGTPGIEWYNGAGQYADQLVSHQIAGGYWDQWVAPEYLPRELSTAFAELILLYAPVVVTYTLTVNVIDAVTLAPIVGASVSAVGPETRLGNTGAGGQIVFNAIQAGSYQVSASATGYTPSGIQLVFVLSDKSTTVSLVPVTANSVEITVSSNPSGTGFVKVDGVATDTPKTFTWTVGSTHSLDAGYSVSGGTGIQYLYSSWSNGGSQTQTYAVPNAPQTLTANYKTQYQVSFALSPSGAGIVSPSSAAYFDSGSPVSISATANQGYTFLAWSSSTSSITFASSSSASTTATINGAGTITATFAYMVSGNRHITLTGSNNVIIISGDNNIIDGTRATSTTIVKTGKGNNLIWLGGGDNIVKRAADGNDIITTGNGNNIITITGKGNNLIIAGRGNDKIQITGDGNNIINAGDGNNVVTVSGKGNNLITTGSGNDVVTAGNGNNSIWTGYGNDQITVGNGNNYIDGGAGSDVCVHGTGHNTIKNCEIT